jgi:hypothetical protein
MVDTSFKLIIHFGNPHMTLKQPKEGKFQIEQVKNLEGDHISYMAATNHQ